MSTRFRFTGRVALLVALLLVLALPQIAAAANTVVTPANPDGWGPTDVRTDATVGITADVARSGDGSLKFTTNTVTNGQDKADFTKTWATPSRTLAALTDVSYEFYRDASSTTDAHFAPVLRLLFVNDNDTPGNAAHDHLGMLIWEQIYNGINPVPTNAWQSENLSTGFFWMRYVGGPNNVGGCNKTIQNFSVTLNDWKTTVPVGQPGDCIAPNLGSGTTYIYGVNTGVGSGWGETFLGYIDNVVVAFGADAVSANFEPTPLCTTVCYADDGGSDSNGGTSPSDAFKTIQKAIDTVAVNGEVRVLPGSYDETATNRYVLDNTPLENGPHQFGLFIAKNGVTIQGVTAGDAAITNPNATQADITTNATNNFGTSGIFVEGDDVTIAGLEIGPNTPGENKTIEIIGDGFTLKDSLMTGDGIDGAYPYFNDWRYDDGTDTAYVKSYTVTHNVFGPGSQVAISSGAGAGGPVSGRQITGNTFTMNAGQNWASISFNGKDTTVPWYTYPVGGAVITGNTFTNNAAGGQHIRLRGIVDDSEFDWASYWDDNTYNKAVVVGPNPPAVVRDWSYTSGSYTFNGVRVIGADIQPEVNHGLAGDTVLVMAGVYPENVTIDKSLTLTGAGQTNDANGTVLEGTGRNGSAIYINDNVVDVTIENLRAQNYNTATPAAGVYANLSNHGLTVQNFTSVNNGVAGNNGGGVYMNGPVDDVLIDHVTATGNRTRGIVIWNGFKSHITITNNTVSGNNCCGIELQDGTAGGVTVTGNTVSGNLDSGMAFIGLTSGAGPNLIADNTITNNGRFGIEIKLPNGTGLTSGDGSIVVEDNTISMSAPLADASGRDGAGISAYRRGWVSGNNNVDIPTGVVIRDNSVTGYQQTSTSDGFGIVVEGLNMHVTGNTLTNNDIGVQVQGGHLPYTANTNIDGNQANLADQFFGRGNSPVGCGLVQTNTFTGNTTDAREVGTGGMVVAKNLDTGELFCTIQAAIDDSDTLAGHTIEVYPGTHAENVTVSKKITLDGAGSGSNPAVDTIITPVSGRGLMITASGTSAADRLVIKDLRVTGAPDDGITLEPPNGGSYLTLDNVASVGQTGAGSDGLEIKHLNLVTDVKIVNSNLSGNGLSGFRMGTGTKLDGLTVENTTFDGNAYGVNIYAANPAPTFDHITFTDVTITNNTQKGIYTERLNNATFTGLTVTGNGSAAAAGFLAGIDINLKYANFSNITIEDSTFENNGLGDINNAGVDLTIKARNDAAYAPSPATLTNLDVNHNVFSGAADVAMSLGNNLDQATTAVNRNAFGGTNTAGFVVFGTAPATMINAECNWWKNASGPSGVGSGSGNTVSANADYTPWLFTNDLDGACVAGGTITVVKQTTPDGDPADFEFDPSWGANFTLSDGESYTSAPLPPATYSVAEVNLAAPWVLDNAACTNGVTTVAPSAIPVAAGETWTCTFENKTPTLCTTVCYADAAAGDDAYNGGTSPSDAFKTIQRALDVVQPGGEVRVLPGTYDQDEKNGVDPNTGGAGANDFNIFVGKAGITIQGVTAADADITTAAGALATIKPKRDVPTFGSSAMFVQADGVTIQGVKFVADNGTAYADKVIEVIGDDVTVDAVAFDVTGGAVGVYVGDFAYDATNNVSTIADYAITNSAFSSANQTGMAFQAANGAGWPDNVGTRTISGNTFTNLDDALTFAGAGSAGWRLYPVGSADITGNTFAQIKRRHVMAWGNYPIANPTSLGYADPDWCGIIANNTFDKGSFLFEGTTNCPTGDPRRWEAASGNAAPYDWFRNVAGIYSAIQQYGVNKAVAGDLLEVMPGIYPENVVLSKSMTIRGAGQTNDANGTVLEGTGLNGSAIYINDNVVDVTIENLRAQNYNTATPAAGVYANLSNHGLTVQNFTSVNNGVAGNNGGGVYMNGPVDDVLIDHVTATGNRTRGIVIWNGFKSHITITNNTVSGNNCCGIELQDGTAGGVTVTGNTVSGNADSGMAFTGLTSGAGPNLIANNTLTNNGRFGIEIKLANGTGLPTGDGSIVVENNTVTLSTPSADLRDFAGIAAFRRGWVAGNNNVDIPTGVIIRNNTVSGYAQNNAGSNSEGFGIVVEGTRMSVTGNTLTNNEVGVQVQGGHLPYTANTNVDGDQSNLADQFFGRGNSPTGCALIDSNTFTGNTADARKVGTGGMVVAKNLDTGELFCTIQAAIDDSDTLAGHTIEVYPGVHTENVLVNKSVTLEGANAGISPNDPGDPLLPNPARVAETEMAVTGGGSAFKVQAANVTIDGFKFTDSAVDLANVQSPIIGAGGNFGGDAPGVKVLNNLFFETNRTAVYFNGPTQMQGGTVDNNRVQDPDRPDTGCTGATAPSGCGHQLFNLWKTNDLSFQGNVTTAAPASGDRIRTLNITDSTNATLAGNTVRYTCTYTCFAIAAGTTNNVTVTGNDLVTDVGNVIQIHSTWNVPGGSINVNHNKLTTGNDFPIVVDALTADLDNVHINRNAVSGSKNARNGNDSLTTPGAETLDVQCNWWGSAAEPTAFFGPNDHTPWLYTSDLDGDCFQGGTITVVKQTTPDGDPAVFEFDPSWGANFTLSDGQSVTSPILPAGPYSVVEVNLASPWLQTGATCDNAATPANDMVDPASITLVDGDAWTCTFENKSVPLCTTVCYADAVGGNDATNGGTSPTDAFKTIQKAIDTVQTGGEVRVLPGTYSETASNRYILGVNGPHVFGLFIAKDITVQGVTAADVAITDPAATEARVETNSTANFGPDGIFVEGDGVTIAGLEIGTNTGGQNKTIEIIGDAFTLKDSFVNDPAGSVYFNDWQFDTGSNTSHVQSYTVDHNIFASGVSIDLTSGAGFSGSVSGRQITDNAFEMGTGENWPSISFNGSGTGVEWFVQSVGGAVITGNTFKNTAYGAVQWIRARGDYDNTQFDWASYWADNTYDNAVVFGSDLLNDLGEYSYTSGSYTFNHVRRIGATIQQEVDHATAGDTVLVNEGTYVEQVVVPKSLTLVSEDGKAITFIKAPATIPAASTQNSVIVKITGAGVQVDISEFTITGPGPSGCGSIGYGIFVRDGAYANIHDNKVVDVRDTGLSGCQNGNAIGVGRQFWSTSGTADITDNEISGYQKTGIIVDNTGSSANITGNTLSGDGPISYIAENGIQISRGATAEINDNTISGHSYAPFTATSAGILLYQGGTVNSDGNTLTENQIGINVIDTSGTHQNNIITATAAGTGSAGFWGIVVDAPPPGRVPSPADGETAALQAPAAPAPTPPVAAQVVVLTGNQLTSDNTAGGVGIEADGGYGALNINLTATKNVIHNWATGVVVYECQSGCTASSFDNVDINRNSIVGNTDGMVADTADAAETDGTCNWWGDDDGPSGEGLGAGDTVSTEVEFNPWLRSSDLDGPCFIGGTISIDKVAPGAGALEFEFDLSWSATNIKLTDAAAPYVTNPPLPAGSYSITEVNVPAGWASQSATCDNATTTPTVETVDPAAITLADGDAWVCTFTNGLQGTIAISKVAAGGGPLEFEFDPSWSATNVMLADGQTTTPEPLVAGNYSIAEVNMPAGWTLDSATCLNGAATAPATAIPVADGDAWVCTFTNAKQGTIQIAKSAPGGGALEFEFDPSWSATNVKLADGQSTTPEPLAAGNYSIAEVNMPAGWTPVSATCDNATTTPTVETVDPAAITLANGDAWVCTFTNAKLGTIQIAKSAPGGGALEFEFDPSWSVTNVKLADGQSTTPEPLAAGNYSITEVNVPAGWTPVSATCDNATTTPTVETVDPAAITLADGDAWVCTFTNTKLGTIQIAKSAPGGGALEFEFDPSWSVTNVKLVDGQSTTPEPLAAGNYSITEVNVPAGWTPVSATCDNATTTPTVETVDPAAITLADGDAWVCTFTNTKLGTIQIAKVAAGGETTEFTFDVSWSGDNVTLLGGQSSTPVALAANTYDIAEVSMPAGWTLSGATCANGQETAPITAIPVENGDAWVCTFTNVKLGTIQIAKVAAGGETTTFEFDVSWSGDNVTLLGGQSSTPVALAANTYSVAEVNVPAGWTPLSATCDNATTTPTVETVDPAAIPVANGDAWLCTFTNTKLGTIQIAKSAPGGGTLEFEFDPSWSATNVKLADGQTTNPEPLAAATYSIAEVNLPTGWTLSGATCVNGQETAPITAIPVENGDAWVCTFTNAKLGTIQIAKLAPGAGALVFTFDVSWSGDNVTLTDGQSTTPVPLAAGSYGITEVNVPPGWASQSATCDNGATQAVEIVDPAAIPVANGDAWVCTFTNSLLGTIRIAKVAVGGDTTEFEFARSWNATNVKLVGGGTTTAEPLAAGTYSVTEVNTPAGWILQSATCDNGSTPAVETVDPANITVANGDQWVCTFTNVKLGTIQIAKVAIGGGTTEFEFDVSWSPTNVKLTNGQSTTPVALTAGQYTIDEVNVPPGWTLGNVSCVNNATNAPITNTPVVNDAVVTVANGDQWVCTFTNVNKGTIQITKVAAGGGATEFEFAVSWSATNVKLTNGQSTTPVALAAGNYSVTEVNVPAGWLPQSATCDNMATTPAVETVNPANITVANGDIWVCTFTNVKQGTVQIAKVAAGGGALVFEFDVSWSPTNVTLTNGQSTTPVALAAGTASISEVNIPTGWALDGVTCLNGQEMASVSAIPVENGDAWVCTFTNKPKGTIKITKSAPGGGTTEFEFDVSWSATNVKLAHGQSTTPVALDAGAYSVSEVNLPLYWMLGSSACVNGAETAPASAIPVENGDAWVCTFNNVYAPSSTCQVGVATTQWTDLLGIGMGGPKKHKAQAKLTIPNYTNLVDLYGQLVAKNNGAAKYVRFMQPGKNNYVEVSVVTSPAEHLAGSFWYGSDLPITAATKSVTGKWFLQKGGTKNHIPRAFVLYPTYNDPSHTYVNVWHTFDASEGEVDWNTAAGWTARRTIHVPIAAPLGPETFHVELALVDNDKDARPVWVTVTAGGVTQTVKPTNPDKGDTLNLLVFDLANVPAGTSEIVIEVYSPSQAIDGIIGDSAALVGMTANYQCSPLTP